MSQTTDGATYANVKSIMLELFCAELSKEPEGSFETEDEIYQRAQSVKQMCRRFLVENQLGEGEKVAVVCHSKLIASVTASGFEGAGATSKLKDYVWT